MFSAKENEGNSGTSKPMKSDVTFKHLSGNKHTHLKEIHLRWPKEKKIEKHLSHSIKH